MNVQEAAEIVHGRAHAIRDGVAAAALEGRVGELPHTAQEILRPLLIGCDVDANQVVAGTTQVTEQTLASIARCTGSDMPGIVFGALLQWFVVGYLIGEEGA